MLATQNSTSILSPVCVNTPVASDSDKKPKSLFDLFKEIILDPSPLIMGLSIASVSILTSSIQPLHDLSPLTPLLGSYFVKTMESPLTRLLFTALGSYSIKILEIIGPPPRSKKEEQERLYVLSLLRVPFIFYSSFYFAGTVGVLIHETGHAIAASIFYKTKPQIAWESLFSGNCQCASAELSAIGNWIGLQNSKLLFTLGGPLTTILVGSLAILTGALLKKSHQELSWHLTAIGNILLLHHVIYAFSTFKWIKSFIDGKLPISRLVIHDFVLLWILAGVHPLIACAAIIALMLLCNWMWFTTPSHELIDAIKK